jgi:hypothetical protein
VQRYGITIPLSGTLHTQRDYFEELASLGYTDLWSAEANTTDGLTPLALASVWAPTLRLGTAILPVYTRGPALLAQSIATMELAAPGGSLRHRCIVERHRRELERHPFVSPYKRPRHRAVPAGCARRRQITNDYETFGVGLPPR